jgi:putative DNA primase/helicase
MVATAASPNIESFAVSKRGGVQYVDTYKDIRVPVCSLLRVHALTADACSNNWGRLVTFSDPTGQEKQHHILNAELMSNGKAVVSELVNKGLDLAGHARASGLLIQYIRSTTPAVKMISSTKPGWVGDSFLLTSGESFGPTRILYSGDFTETRHSTAGNWKSQVGRYCSGNSRFLLAASAAFAGPLLELVHMVEGGGFHFRGEAALGKSTALEIASSVFGHPDDVKRGWDATKGSFEAVAEAHSDQLLVLDEIGMADERTVGDVVYLLANGASKARMKEQRRKWRVLSLSSGEISLAEHMSKMNLTPMPGQETRLLDVPIEPVEGKMYRGVRMGAVENVHRFANSKALADHLKAATRTNYGVFTDFIKLLVRRQVQTRRMATRLVDQFVADATPAKSSGQVGRAVSRFAVVAAGGEIATSFGLTGWQKGEATEAAIKCFGAWHEYFTSYDPLSKSVGTVREFISSNSEFFQDLGRGVEPVKDRVGYRKKGLFLILPEVFREVICAGLVADETAKSLETAGFLLTSGANRLMYSNRVTGNPTPQRFYAVKDSILAA